MWLFFVKFTFNVQLLKKQLIMLYDIWLIKYEMFQIKKLWLNVCNS